MDKPDEVANLKCLLIQTIMSTDIIQFKDNEEDYQSAALKWFAMVTVPFVVATFVTWYGFYWWARRKERLAAAGKADLERQ